MSNNVKQCKQCKQRKQCKQCIARCCLHLWLQKMNWFCFGHILLLWSKDLPLEIRNRSICKINTFFYISFRKVYFLEFHGNGSLFFSHVGKFVEKLSQDLFEESREDLLWDWAGIFVWTNSEWFRHHLSFSEKRSDAKEEMKKGRFVTFQPQIHILKSWNSGILI